MEKVLGTFEESKGSGDSVELEFRLGQHRNGNFVSGFPPDSQSAVKNLIRRLRYNAECPDLPWTMKTSSFIVAQYEDGIRHICGLDKSEKFQRKEVLASVDFAANNRPYNLRLSLSREQDVCVPVDDMRRKTPPKSVRIVLRHSFTETTDTGTVFRYDISKVSPEGKDKMECSKKPCYYHCEVEYVSGTFSFDSLWTRAISLLGSHRVYPDGRYEKLPKPELTVMKSFTRVTSPEER